MNKKHNIAGINKFLFVVLGDVMDAIFCGVTRIRLVSSGNVNNIITLTMEKVQIEESTDSGILCPSVSGH